jgi:hypothetical protein
LEGGVAVVNPVDSLPVIAEASLGLVGLTAIVTVLRRPDGGFEGLDLIRSIHLFVYSGATLLLSLLPALLTAMGCDLPATWRISSVAMLVCSLVGFATNPRPRRPAGSLSADMALLIAIYAFAALNVVLQLANAVGVFGLPRFWPFLLGLFWYLVFCLTQFAGLLFLRPSE